MSSYCEVCQSLFDVPHQHHDHCTGCCNHPRENVRGGTSPPHSSTRLASPASASASGVSPCYGSSSSRHNSPRVVSIRQWRNSTSGGGLRNHYRRPTQHRASSSSSSSHVSRGSVPKNTSSQRRPLTTVPTTTPMGRSAERETVNSLLRMSPKLRGSALVRTPSRRGYCGRGSSGGSSNCRRRGIQYGRGRVGDEGTTAEQIMDIAHSLEEGEVLQERLTGRLDHLQDTLERIREAVRRDNCTAALAASNTPAAAITNATNGSTVYAGNVYEEEDMATRLFVDSLLGGSSGKYEALSQHDIFDPVEAMEMGATRAAEQEETSVLGERITVNANATVAAATAALAALTAGLHSWDGDSMFVIGQNAPLAASTEPYSATEMITGNNNNNNNSNHSDSSGDSRRRSSSSSSGGEEVLSSSFQLSHKMSEGPRNPHHLPQTTSPSLISLERHETPKEAVLPVMAAAIAGSNTFSTGMKKSKHSASAFPVGGLFDSPSTVSYDIGNSNSGSNAARGGRCDIALESIDMLREGFVDLCGAVREDLHALHARVDELCKQQRKQKQQQQQQHVQDPVLAGLSQQQMAGVQYGDDVGVIHSSIAYDKLLAEMKQFTLSTMHRLLRQQRERTVAADGSSVPAGGSVPFPPSAFPAPPPQWSTSPKDELCGFSLETLDEHVRLAVRSILSEDFPHEIKELLRQQEEQRRHLKASRRESKRHVSSLQQQINMLADTIGSMQLELEELRLVRVVPSPVLSSSTPAGATQADRELYTVPQRRRSTDPPFPPHKLGVRHTAAEVWATEQEGQKKEQQQQQYRTDDNPLLRRLESLVADAEERCLQRVRAEIMQPMLEHMRRLMSAHQSMIDTVVENRCAQVEAAVQRGRHGVELQLADVRSRMGSLRSDVHRAIRDLSENLNVACPGL